MLPKTAPSIMAARSGDACNHSAKKIVKKIIVIDKLIRFPLPVNHLHPKTNNKPVTAPIPSDTTISIKGFNICSHMGDADPVGDKAFATATKIPNKIMATESSIATTDKSVSVSLPFALYCLTTMMVAAGAVAAAIADKTRANLKFVIDKSPLIKK